MPKTMGRRRALAALLSLPPLLLAVVPGCGDSDQRKTGTMVKPSDIIEKKDELRAKRQELERKKK
jgi:hypothetical protein